MKHFTL